MLVHLGVRDFAIVDRLELELEPGMTVLTGETGAGKSILVDALGLALGDRASSTDVRTDRERAEVSAVFDLDDGSPVLEFLARHDLDEPGGECVLRRTIAADGRSRAFVNGRPTPVQMLRSIGDMLVDIHGQHAHHSLLRREVQRQLLDDWAGNGSLRAEVSDCHARWHEAARELDALAASTGDAGARLDYLAFQIAELERLDASAEEVAALGDEHRRLAHASDLADAAREALERVDAEEGAALDVIDSAARRLATQGNLDRRLAAIGDLLAAAVVQGREAAGDLRRYLDGIDGDPERLSVVEARLANLHDAARKHRVRPEELATLLERMRAEASAIEGTAARRAALEKARAGALAAYADAAGRLHAARSAAAPGFAERVTANLADLGMAGATFAVRVSAEASAPPARHGHDIVELLVSANAGQPLQPLGRVASGGELARISLAIQVVATGEGAVPTLIFDEVDVGVGGRHAEIVGRRLRDLATRSQVLCVTHLPQVAALGDHHVEVRKTTENGCTRTEMELLRDEQRVREVARMLGGIEITRSTLAHAREMLGRG